MIVGVFGDSMFMFVCEEVKKHHLPNVCLCMNIDILKHVNVKLLSY